MLLVHVLLSDDKVAPFPLRGDGRDDLDELGGWGVVVVYRTRSGWSACDPGGIVGLACERVVVLVYVLGPGVQG